MPVNLNLSQKCMAVLVPLVACYVGNLIDNQIRLDMRSMHNKSKLFGGVSLEEGQKLCMVKGVKLAEQKDGVHDPESKPLLPTVSNVKKSMFKFSSRDTPRLLFIVNSCYLIVLMVLTIVILFFSQGLQKGYYGLRIIGSHDSFAFYLNDNEKTQPPDIHINSIAYNGLRSKILKFSITQRLQFVYQLHIGIRYFDLRLAWLNGQPLYVHAFYGNPIYPSMHEMNTFLEKYTTEVVILHFQHIYDFNTEREDLVHRQLKEIFGSKLQYKILLNEANWRSKLTPYKMTQEGFQVIVIWPGSTNKDYIWSRSTITTPYPNKYRVNDLLNYLRRRVPAKNAIILHVTQLIFTVSEYMHNDSLESYTMNFIQRFNEYLATKRGFNIVIRDFVDLDFSTRVLELNKHTNNIV